MKLNRKWIMIIALVMSMAMATGGTLAYLTDRDSEANVFTFGDVKIEIAEKFEPESPLVPNVKVEKEVAIKNTGNTDAWVWYTITYPKALDLTDTGETILWTGFTTENHDNTGYEGANDGVAEWLIEYAGEPYLRYFTKDGVDMVEFTVLYQQALAKNETTPPSLECVYLDKHIDIDPDGNLTRVENGNVEKIDWNVETQGYPTVYISAYAIQKEGFDTVKDAYAAYTKQWGENGTEYGSGEDDTSDIPADAVYVQTFAALKDAITAANGGTVVLNDDIVFEEPIVLENGESVVLHMNGKTITPASTAADPFFDTYPGTTLVLTGNGTFDLGDNPGMSVLMPGGNVTIKNGTFLKGRSDNVNGPLIAAYSRAEGTFIIEGGYFDGGYYKEGDCFNNCRNGVNLTGGNTYRIYGGTFVGQNPAWGDEGRAVLCPHCENNGSNCQGIFLEGQTTTSTELPAGYTITEGKTEDGRPTYTVNYTK